MIIDFHSHIWRREWRNESMWDAMADLVAQRLGTGKRETSREAIKNDIFANYLDPMGERHLRQMEEAGIDMTVLHPLDYGLGPGGEPFSPIEEQNAAHAELVARYPDKFTAFVGVDPRRPKAIELIERGVNDWGFKGLKLHPATGFYPHQVELEPIYEKACKLGIPVLIHTGHISRPLDARYAHPKFLEDVAVRYPELTIIAAHMGYDWWEELAEVGLRRPNVGTDISGWQPMALSDAGSFFTALNGVFDSLGARKVFFGTDGLIFGRAVPAGEWVKFVRNLAGRKLNDSTIGETDVEALLGLNAKRVLGL